MPTAVRFLAWSDVAPSRRAPFDRARARAIAAELIEAAVSGPRGRLDRAELEIAIDRAFLAEYGAWAGGWRWAASEPGCGGPVRAWCCADDSLLPRKDGGSLRERARSSADRAAAALAEWRAFLEELEERFAELPDVRAPDAALNVERAAARLLPLVLERTGNEDAWYATFAKVVSWYLESKGHDARTVEPLVKNVIGRRFASWTAPDEATATVTCGELGASVAGARRIEPADGLEAWLAIRANAFGQFARKKRREPVRVDGHRRFVNGPERARDPDRADAMEVALDACRASAAAAEDLTFERLADWQAIVLGGPRPTFRTTDAYGKAGRERYGRVDLRARFDRCLAEAHDRAPVAVRAARAYLDVCFFHPFADGNARAARLALDHVLTRDGLGLHTAEPLFVVSRAASDAGGAWYLAYLVDYLIGPTA